MNGMKKYLVWIVVAALVLGSGFFVYKKMYADKICIIGSQC